MRNLAWNAGLETPTARETREVGGSLWGGGDNSNGQLGLGHQNPVDGLVQLSDFNGKEVKAIGINLNHSLLLLKSGEVFGMGDNTYGQLPENPIGSIVSKPVKLSDNAIAVACGAWNSEILGRNGVLMSYGSNWTGQLGGGVRGDVAQTVRVRF